MCAIPVPFDPRDIFGKARVPVVVSINGYTYRSTIFTMGKDAEGHACRWIPLRKSNREAAKVNPAKKYKITLTLDDTPRTIAVPKDLASALRAAGLTKVFAAMSFTHRREHIEAITQAKKPETRQRRIDKCIAMTAASAK